jgi:hypothetical protein
LPFAKNLLIAYFFQINQFHYKKIHDQEKLKRFEPKGFYDDLSSLEERIRFPPED